MNGFWWVFSGRVLGKPLVKGTQLLVLHVDAGCAIEWVQALVLRVVMHQGLNLFCIDYICLTLNLSFALGVIKILLFSHARESSHGRSAFTRLWSFDATQVRTFLKPGIDWELFDLLSHEIRRAPVVRDVFEVARARGVIHQHLLCPVALTLIFLHTFQVPICDLSLILSK